MTCAPACSACVPHGYAYSAPRPTAGALGRHQAMRKTRVRCVLHIALTPDGTVVGRWRSSRFSIGFRTCPNSSSTSTTTRFLARVPYLSALQYPFGLSTRC
jgi:hypothetical protein